jgi:hypothetical protein
VNTLHVCGDLVGVLSRSLRLMDGGQATEACLRLITPYSILSVLPVAMPKEPTAVEA